MKQKVIRILIIIVSSIVAIILIISASISLKHYILTKIINQEHQEILNKELYGLNHYQADSLLDKCLLILRGNYPNEIERIITPLAFYKIDSLAQIGNPNAQFALAEIYDSPSIQTTRLEREGNNVGIFRRYGNDNYNRKYENATRSSYWYLQAAEKGNTIAQMRIALYYCRGKGVEVDSVQALKWAHEAAKNNNDVAQRIIGDMYYTGINGNLEANLDSARFWWHKASVNGNEDAKDSYEKNILT